MCGIAAIMDLEGAAVPNLARMLQAMNGLQRHRGPDGEGAWTHPGGMVGFGHRRLSIIDPAGGRQPMRDGHGNWVTFNGEIYNYRELRAELGQDRFLTESDTEVILHAYRKWGADCVHHLRGMFAFALWDEECRRLFCARDRFGIKPLYYMVVDSSLYVASEIKALLPFIDEIETNLEAFKEYLTFQFCLSGKTLFQGIHELVPGHVLFAGRGHLETKRYWEVYYDLDWDHTGKYFEERIRALIKESVALHVRSDVPIGAYISGGMDSGIVASLASAEAGQDFMGFTGKFALGPAYDESRYARALADWRGFPLHDAGQRSAMAATSMFEP